MFSSRVPEGTDFTLNPLTQRLHALRDAGVTLCDLTVSNPTIAEIAYPQQALLQALSSPAALTYVPNALGSLAAREVVARYYAREHHVTVSPEQTVLTASTSESYGLLFKILCDPGDEVLIPAPSYPLFEHLAAMECVRTICWPLVLDGGHWQLDLETLASRITARTRAIIVVSPNNPTGSCVSAEAYEKLLSLCARHQLALIVDEVFLDYVIDPSPHGTLSASVLESDALVFTLGGLSKWAGLPQLKLGWMVVSGPASLRSAALSRLDLACDTMLSVNAVVQCALPALEPLCREIHENIRARVAHNRAWASRFLRDHTESTCSVLPSHGGWSLVVRVPFTRTDEAWAIALLDHDRVIVAPGYFFDIPSQTSACLVVSTLTPPAKFEQGMRALIARCDSDR